jgi:LmbE family N-acetylglucosaminyl deacetylase
LAAILREEQAEVLTSYDARGGYGHPDHRKVHLVARHAATAAGTPVLLEATLDRDRLRAGLALIRWAGRYLPRLPLDAVSTAYSARTEITHVIDVRHYWRQKRSALRAHDSQAEGGSGVRTVAMLGRLPGPLFALVCGREWFIEVGNRPDHHHETDIFAGLRKTV